MWGYEATLPLVARVPVQLSGSILHQGRWWWFIEKLDMEGNLPGPYPLWSCNCDSVLWVGMTIIQSAVWGHLQAEDIYPSAKCMWSCRHPLPLHVTWSLHPSSVDAVADIHGRSHTFPLIHPREVLLAWCWVITRPLSTYDLISLSLPLGVGLTGVGLVYLSHAWQTPCTREYQSLTQWGEVSCSVGCMTVCIGLLLHTRRCLSWSDALPHEVHPLTYL